MGEEEFRSLYERLSARIFSFAARQLPPEVAKDVVSETFEVAWIKSSEVPRDPDAAAAWVFGVAKNKILQAHQHKVRKHHDHRFAADFQERTRASRDTADTVTESALGRWVYRRLTANERELLDVAFIQDTERADAAAMLGLSVGAFNTRVSRLRSRINELTRLYEDPAPARGAR
ncbi:RNA polymerase sigma factor [Aeromicrobium sp. Sec7.5]|uniref:RNA polymerase sigma factor n=1 Tax=Aeromicrobium sp. Sec7.5 TaxID=3121276 RepID=UPI002FE47C16